MDDTNVSLTGQSLIELGKGPSSYRQRYSINRRISKSTQIIFSPILFGSNSKMKLIHKKSDPPTQVRRRGDFLKILHKNRKSS